MTASAADKRYGRRSGRWADRNAGRLAEGLARVKDPLRLPVDLGALFHPDTIARQRAHARRIDVACERPCRCQPSIEDLEACWLGRGRMARARRSAGVTLDRLDREALFRLGDINHV